MNFQQGQEEARQQTFRLIVLLVLGVGSIVAITTALLTGLLYYGSGQIQPLAALVVAAPVTIIAVGGASLVKSNQIRSGGGSYVAQSLGGRPVDFNTLDPGERQLTNVVEEMAIASGLPVPAVFVLDDEDGINAFAAGWSVDSAAIGVTRGALHHLTRNELQGVIAHEFSHLANGDTRVKTRIIGWIYGIAILTVLGQLILRSSWFLPRRRGNGRDGNGAVVAVLAAGVGLLVIGWIGTFFARAIQAAVSRQREYLADASAVQYTRDPDGIGGALLKIGSLRGSNTVSSAHATETDHLFITPAFKSTMASHPPLPDRISRLIPTWDGTFPDPPAPPAPAADLGPPPPPARSATTAWGGALPGRVPIPGVPGPFPAAASGFSPSSPPPPKVGPGPSPAPGAAVQYQPPRFEGPTPAHVEHARGLLQRIPTTTRNALHTRQGAVAAVVGALCSTDPTRRRAELELAARATFLDPDYLDAAGRLLTDLDRPLQLPAVDIALHPIGETPAAFQDTLVRTIAALNPGEEDLFRWVLRRVVLRHLAARNARDQPRDGVDLGRRQPEAATVLAVLATHNSAGPGQADRAYAAALASLGAPAPTGALGDGPAFAQLDVALTRLADLDADGRRRFVDAATTVVLDDGRASADEAELLRVTADAVGLPVPPLLPV